MREAIRNLRKMVDAMIVIVMCVVPFILMAINYNLLLRWGDPADYHKAYFPRIVVVSL